MEAGMHKQRSISNAEHERHNNIFRHADKKKQKAFVRLFQRSCSDVENFFTPWKCAMLVQFCTFCDG